MYLTNYWHQKSAESYILFNKTYFKIKIEMKIVKKMLVKIKFGLKNSFIGPNFCGFTYTYLERSFKCLPNCPCTWLSNRYYVKNRFRYLWTDFKNSNTLNVSWYFIIICYALYVFYFIFCHNVFVTWFQLSSRKSCAFSLVHLFVIIFKYQFL